MSKYNVRLYPRLAQKSTKYVLRTSIEPARRAHPPVRCLIHIQHVYILYQLKVW